MSGLNDDFVILDDSTEKPDDKQVVLKVFKDTAEPGEVPELDEDIDLIAVATEEFGAAMRDLQLLGESIVAAGGMSTTIALEAQALIPDFINDDRPLGFFSKHPSRTMLNVALEEIAEEKKNVVKRMVDKFVEFIKQIIAKINSFLNGGIKIEPNMFGGLKDIDKDLASIRLGSHNYLDFIVFQERYLERHIDNCFQVVKRVNINSLDNISFEANGINPGCIEHIEETLMMHTLRLAEAKENLSKEEVEAAVLKLLASKDTKQFEYIQGMCTKSLESVEYMQGVLEALIVKIGKLDPTASVELTDQVTNSQKITTSFINLITLLQKYVRSNNKFLELVMEHRGKSPAK